MDTDEDQLIDEPTLLKALLKVRHWQKLDTFARQWDKVAKTIDSRLVGSCPAHAQFYRWLSGSIRSMPHPDACRILETMFSGWTVQQLFRPVRTSRSMLQPAPTAKPDNNENVATLAQQLREPGTGSEDSWTKTWDVRSRIINPGVLPDGGKLANRSCSRNTKIAVKQDAVNLAKFATLVSPSISPGDTARISYSCYGGLFTDSLYWRQNLPRDVRHFTLTVRQRVSNELLSCSATEELPDGSERSAMEGLIWDTRAGYHTIGITHDYLERNQAITISWELDR